MLAPMDIDRARRVRREIAGLALSGLDSSALAARAEVLLLSVIPFDRACWHNVDPGTSMLTSIIGASAPTSPLLPVLEYGTHDVNQYADLARAKTLAGGLHAATGGAPRTSRRYREVLVPMQMEDELTAAFVVDSKCWGCARLYRGARWPAFDAVEIAFVASLAVPLAQGFRSALLHPAEHAHDVPHGPGVILLDGDGALVSMSGAAQRWLGEVIDATPDAATSLPRPLMAVAGRARLVANGSAGTDMMARCRVRTRSGRWLILSGERIRIADRKHISLIVEPARAPEIAPLIVSAYGLTERERQVTGHVLRGLANKEIAQALGLSPYTVSDHVRLIFEKVGVRTRTELAARIFFEHCYPGIAAGGALGADGWFV